MSSFAYHFTDTARLPWILDSGALRPGRNKIGPFPDPDFLWATTSSVGDRSASASMDALRDGRVRLVRFALPRWAFTSWREMAPQFPAWTPALVERLERSARGSDPRLWLCRTDELPASFWISIETRTWTDKIWCPLPTPYPIMPFEADSIGVPIGDKVYVSSRRRGPQGQDAYAVTVLDGRAAA